ncbi:MULTISPECIES: SCO3374 family protein [Streptomyces]|uniref:SCO3374 family protein n=1 Tax=Streptomyces TaxID=1883 RepID=UPI00345B8B4A
MTACPPRPGGPAAPWCQARWWYERALGWPTSGKAPLELLTGVRFDALGLPLDAGAALLGRPVRTGPVVLDARARRLWFLLAAGSADELPVLLDWLEWGEVALDLAVLGPGGRIAAPVPAGPERAVWVRPPRPGKYGGGGGVEPPLPVTGLGGEGNAPDLARLVGAAATEAHRARLLRARRARRRLPGKGQALAFSYASRMSAGTRPRSLTL